MNSAEETSILRSMPKFDYKTREHLVQEETIASNGAYLSASRFAKMEFLLPPHGEQQQIVAEVERRLSVIDELEAAVQTNFTRVERLRLAILSQAFSGELHG
jgi:restriction endonuclease S subunit